MPTWNQIQSQLRHPNNPVVFFDVNVGTIVSVMQLRVIHIDVHFMSNLILVVFRNWKLSLPAPDLDCLEVLITSVEF